MRFRGDAALAGVAISGVLSLSVAAAGVESSLWRIMLALGSFAPAAAGIWLRRRWDREPSDAELELLRVRCRQQLAEQERESAERQELHAALLKDLAERTQDLNAREQDLAGRLARFQEFLEYPTEDLHVGLGVQELQGLGEQDRAVRQLLEVEAERVYEKIRGNGYSLNGEVNLLMIRDEVLDLIRRVALVYRPGVEQPLSDVSLEQLARAASRIWLHLLVLLEQLPLPVQQYSIGTLYSWIRRAVIGYGVYQKASPWLTLAARGISAGRLVAGANPAVLGAWWLATELGRQGTRKWIEQTVDRQAVGLLRQLISVVGVEAAGIFGTGFRQRDPAWVLGTELVELVSSFPPSGESLRHGLTAITALPLLTEYDRIYLYRCLASHRSAGLQLADPALLGRVQREDIARVLEAFFGARIHGATESAVRRWREAVEQRLDLRLNLQSAVGGGVNSVSQGRERLQAAGSLWGFLEDVVHVSGEQLQSVWGALSVPSGLSAEERRGVLEARSGGGQSFVPPELDPASEVTDLFLRDLMSCATVSEPSEAVEQLAVETAYYFRRTAEDARKWLDEAWRGRLRLLSAEPEFAERLAPGAARLIVEQLRERERLMFVYSNLWRVELSGRVELAGAVLGGLEQPEGERRLVVLCPQSRQVLWEAGTAVSVERIAGVFVDDLLLRGGEWKTGAVGSGGAGIQVSGSLRGGRYGVWFEKLLRWVGAASV